MEQQGQRVRKGAEHHLLRKVSDAWRHIPVYKQNGAFLNLLRGADSEKAPGQWPIHRNIHGRLLFSSTDIGNQIFEMKGF